MKNENTFGSRLRSARKAQQLTQRQLAERIKAAHNSISNWENDQNMPDPDTIVRICEVLNVTAGYLLDTEQVHFPNNLRAINSNNVHRVPMIGSVAAGEPIIAEQEYETYVPGPLKADFALTVSGDSMAPTFMDGDVVYLKQMDDVSDGQIAAVITDDEARLKRVYHIPDGLNLVSDNPLYPPVTGTAADYTSIRVLGLVVGYTRMF